MNNRIVLLILLIVLAVGAIILLLPNTSNKSLTPGQPNTTGAPVQAGQQLEIPTEKAAVTVSESGFTPETITVKVGEQVTWINKSGKTVSLNSAAHPNHLVYPALNLGEFANEMSVQLKFEKSGTYRYHNHLIPDQTGTVIVE